MDQEHPPRRAVALEYDGNQAPLITATGEAELAEQIIAIAQQHNIPLYENRELSTLLAHLELGDAIPEPLYRAIAEIIAFAYMMAGKVPEGFVPPSEENNDHKKGRTFDAPFEDD